MFVGDFLFRLLCCVVLCCVLGWCDSRVCVCVCAYTFSVSFLFQLRAFISYSSFDLLWRFSKRLRAKIALLFYLRFSHWIRFEHCCDGKPTTPNRFVCFFFRFCFSLYAFTFFSLCYASLCSFQSWAHWLDELQPETKLSFICRQMGRFVKHFTPNAAVCWYYRFVWCCAINSMMWRLFICCFPVTAN